MPPILCALLLILPHPPAQATLPAVHSGPLPAVTALIRADAPRGFAASEVLRPQAADPSANPASPTAVRLAEFLAGLGPAAPIAFVALFVLFTVLCLPAGVMTLLGGFLFGPALGFLYVWVAALLGASAAFGVSRHLARAWVQRRLSNRPLLTALEQAVSEEGWRIVVLSRLAPGSPFFLLNYLFGLTRIGFRDYFWATAISVIPGSFLIVYVGSMGQLALTGRIRSPAAWALYGIGLLALALGVALIGRRAHRLLKQKLEQDPHSRANPQPPRDPR